MRRIVSFAFAFSSIVGVAVAQEPGERTGTPPPQNASSSSKAQLSVAKAQLRSPPKASTPDITPGGLLMDINADDFCKDGGVAPLLRQYIDDATDILILRETRAVALVARIAFAESATSSVATVPLALIPPKGAKDAQGKEIEPVINCQGKILGGLPANQPLTVRLDIAYSSKFQMTDAAQKALNLVGSALTTAALLGPHTATAGVGILAFSSKLGDVTQKTNEFLALLEETTTDVPTTFRWEAKTRALAFRAGKPLTLSKTFKNTTLNLDAANVLTWPDAFRKGFGDTNALQSVYDKAGVQFGALGETPTPANYRTFCRKLNEEASKAYGSDQSAVAMAIYYFLVDNKSAFESKKETCLTNLQIDVLKRVGVTTAPYEGAFSPGGASGRSGPAPGDRAEPVNDDEFETAKDMMEALARAVKNAPARAAQGPAELQALRNSMLRIFSRDVIATAYGTDLLPNSERGIDSQVIVDHLLKWGDISRFGCFAKPEPPNTRKSTAETLILFSQRKLLILAKFTKEPKKDVFTAIDMVKAREDDVTRLLGGRSACGRLDDEWDPRVDFKKLNS